MIITMKTRIIMIVGNDNNDNEYDDDNKYQNN